MLKTSSSNFLRFRLAGGEKYANRLCTPTHWSRNLKSKFLIAVCQQQAAPTAIWVEAWGERSLRLASIPHLQLSRCSLRPPFPLWAAAAAAAALCCHFKVRVHCWGMVVVLVGYLVSCHAGVESKNWTTLLCMRAETLLEYELIHDRMWTHTEAGHCHSQQKKWKSWLLVLFFRFAPSLLFDNRKQRWQCKVSHSAIVPFSSFSFSSNFILTV